MGLPESARAIRQLLDGPPEWWTRVPSESPGYRLQGVVDGEQVKLVVLPKPWHSIPYVPVATGSLAHDSNGTVLRLAFRPRHSEVAVLSSILVLAVGIGSSVWFVLGALCFCHLVGCITGFSPEVSRVVGILRWVFGGRVGVPRYEDGAAEQADAADEAQGGTRTAS